MPKHKTKNHKAQKALYRPRNWSAYNKSLVQRGLLTLWISEEVLANWHPNLAGRKERGGQIQYSEQAILCVCFP